jgi:hypothetical protein
MKKILITMLVLLVAAVAIITVIADISSNRPGKRPSNPFAFDVDEYKSVSPDLLQWEETRQVALDTGSPQAMAYSKGNIYLVHNNELQVIGGDWKRTLRKPLSSAPSCIGITNDGMIIIAFGTYLSILDKEGEIIVTSEPMEGSSFTSLAEHNGAIYVADGRARKVRIFNFNLEQTGEFNGESGVSEVHGFILPDGHFSLAVNSEDELWITNPGLHSLQNYSSAGRLRSFFQSSSFGIEGFAGCCNPQHLAFLAGGEFVTSEKGLIRIKIMKDSGEIVSVVAPPESFENGTRAPAVAVDDHGNVLALDFDRNMIRIFEPVSR